VPPDTTAALSELAGLTTGEPATASLRNDGAQQVRRLRLRLATRRAGR
jgi:hypothetical protein